MSHRSFGSVSGMAECYHLGKGAGLCRFAPIYCETGKGNGVIKGSFTCFGHPELTQARADINSVSESDHSKGGWFQTRSESGNNGSGKTS